MLKQCFPFESPSVFSLSLVLISLTAIIVLFVALASNSCIVNEDLLTVYVLQSLCLYLFLYDALCQWSSFTMIMMISSHKKKRETRSFTSMNFNEWIKKIKISSVFQPFLNISFSLSFNAMPFFSSALPFILPSILFVALLRIQSLFFLCRKDHLDCPSINPLLPLGNWTNVITITVFMILLYCPLSFFHVRNPKKFSPLCLWKTPFIIISLLCLFVFFECVSETSTSWLILWGCAWIVPLMKLYLPRSLLVMHLIVIGYSMNGLFSTKRKNQRNHPTGEDSSDMNYWFMEHLSTMVSSLAFIIAMIAGPDRLLMHCFMLMNHLFILYLISRTSWLGFMLNRTLLLKSDGRNNRASCLIIIGTVYYLLQQHHFYLSLHQPVFSAIHWHALLLDCVLHINYILPYLYLLKLFRLRCSRHGCFFMAFFQRAQRPGEMTLGKKKITIHSPRNYLKVLPSCFSFFL